MYCTSDDGRSVYCTSDDGRSVYCTSDDGRSVYCTSVCIIHYQLRYLKIDMFILFTNKYTISVHCRKIYNLFARALETGSKASFSSLLHSKYKLM